MAAFAEECYRSTEPVEALGSGARQHGLCCAYTDACIAAAGALFEHLMHLL
jgi:hypothetical protein